jgi:hypothetical protein
MENFLKFSPFFSQKELNFFKKLIQDTLLPFPFLKKPRCENSPEKKTLVGTLLIIEIWQIGEDILD